MGATAVAAAHVLLLQPLRAAYAAAARSGGSPTASAGSASGGGAPVELGGAAAARLSNLAIAPETTWDRCMAEPAVNFSTIFSKFLFVAYEAIPDLPLADIQCLGSIC